jgi:small subunit ribosomal protein S17
MTKTLTGIVTSDRADKTITITVVSRQTHPIYGKQYSVTRKYAAHDENNEAKLGDKVIISESRPISKSKSYKLDKILEKSHGSIQLKDETEVLVPKPEKSDEKPKAVKDKPSKNKEVEQ